MAVLFVGFGGFATIQAAVDAAGNGDTIQISNGTYAEQVVVNAKDNLSFIGETRNGVVITAPATLVQTATDNGSPSGSPTNVNLGLLTLLNGADGTSISNITIDGANRGDTVSDNKYVGLDVINSTGTVVNNVTVTRVDDITTNPTQNAFGILVDLGRTFTSTNGSFQLTNSQVDHFGKTGIVLYDVAANIISSTVIGDGPTSQTAQNGIQISGSGFISGNTISEVAYTGDPTAGTGVGLLILGNQGLTVTNNSLTNVQVGIAEEFDVNSISTIDFSTNTVTNPDPNALGAFVGVLDATLNNLTIIGTNAPDQLNGSNGNDRIDGQAGADQMGNVDGTTTLGNDTYVVDNVGDEVFEDAASGTDTIETNLTFYSLVPIANLENLTGTSNSGQALTGNSLTNVISAGNGNDSLEGLGGPDQLFGGGGTDTASYANAPGPVRVNLTTFGALGDAAGDTYNSIENIIGSGFGDDLTGDGGNNQIDGGAGIDTMAGLAGDDTYSVTESGDIINESVGEGTDRVFASVSHTLAPNVEVLILTNGAVNGTGNASNNVIVGNDLDNTLIGAGGDDLMKGGLGSDTYDVTDPGDQVVENLGEGANDRVFSSIDYTLTANVEHLILAGSAVAGTGNGLNNVIAGNTVANILTGNAGDDLFTGDAGGDTFVFNSGDGHDQIKDFVAGNGSGHDILQFSSAIFTDESAALAAAHQVGSDVVITEDASNDVRLFNVSLAALTLNDFQIV